MVNNTDYSVLCKDGENQDAKRKILQCKTLKDCKKKEGIFYNGDLEKESKRGKS